MTLVLPENFIRSDWKFMGNHGVKMVPDRGFEIGRVWRSLENRTKYMISPFAESTLETPIPAEGELLEGLPCVKLCKDEFWEYDIHQLSEWESIYIVHKAHFLSGKLLYYRGMSGIFCIQGTENEDWQLQRDFPVSRFVVAL